LYFGMLIAGLVAGFSPNLRAQTANAAQPAAWSLFTVRYDTRTSDFIYALYGYGSTFAMVGALHNPRTNWSELLGAVGRTFSAANGGSYAVAAGVAQTPGQWYAQLYYVPHLRVGPVALHATTEWDVPLNDAGVMQFAFSPLAITIPTAHALEIGLAMDLAATRGDRSAVALGPELRATLPHAVLGIDAEQFATERGGRFRVFFTTQF
jgi:hypothetical protein